MKPRFQTLRSDINFLTLALNKVFTRTVQATARKEEPEQFSVKQMRLNLNNLEKYFKKYFCNATLVHKTLKNFNFSNLHFKHFSGQVECKTQIDVQARRVQEQQKENSQAQLDIVI